MRGTRGRRLSWLLGAALFSAGTLLALPIVGGACTKVATTVTLTSSENPAVYGDQVILTATVIPATGTEVPGGSVTFADSGSSLGSVALDADGQAALAASTLDVGAHQIEAQYSGSTEFSSADSSPLSEQVTVQGSMTLLLATVNPAGYGQTLVFVVSVLAQSGSAVPTGTVTLWDGSCSIGSGSLTGGTAAVAVSSLGVGSHSLSATYPGDGNFSASSSGRITEQVDPASTSTALTVSPSSVATGKPATLTASVTSSTLQPSGTVTFSTGTTPIGSATLSGGTAQLVACFDQRGSYPITAAYAGTPNVTGSTSTAVTLQVTSGCGGGGGCTVSVDDAVSAGAATLEAFRAELSRPAELVTLLSTSPTPAPPALVTVGAAPTSVNTGQSVTLTSVVYGNSGAPYPSGTVEFLQGASVLGSAPTTQISTTNDALAVLSVILSAGTYPSITAEYQPNAAGRSWYTSATSPASASVTVARVAASTTLAVATSLNPAKQGQALIATATVNHPSSSLTPTGTVTFTVNGTKVGTASLDGLAQATVNLPALSAGHQTIAASYAGDENFSSSTGSTVETVTSTGSPTPTPTATPTPTPTGKPTPTPTPTPTATPEPTSTARPTPPPPPAATPVLSSTAPAAPVIVPPVTAPPNRPSGLSGSAPVNPDQIDTSAVPPIDLISLVSGIHMGSAPQIIIFVLIGNALLLGAIVVAARRGRNLTRSTLEYVANPPDPIAGAR